MALQNVSLDPGEKIVLKSRKHWILLLRDTIGTIVVGLIPAIVVPLVIATVPSLYLDAIGYGALASFAIALWLLVIWLALCAIWTDYYLDLFIVTDRRVININQRGLFDRQVASWSLDKVQEVIVRSENVVQHFFGYGSMVLETAGPSDEYTKVEGLPNPEKARSTILAQLGRVGELEVANERQKGLLHSIAHEVKGYLTKSEAAFASIAEGDFGAVSPPLKTIANSALSETRKGVDTVMGILDASNFKAGTMSLEKKRFDARTTIQEIANELRPTAEKKGLTFEVLAGEGDFALEGDEAKLRRHVFRNLIDNAIRYTKSGAIHVMLVHSGSTIGFAVKDTGVGITPEDMAMLFTEGGKGKNSAQVNPESTGYGLFVARMLVEAHGGKIWAESDGEGHGAQFFVELPAA